MKKAKIGIHRTKIRIWLQKQADFTNKKVDFRSTRTQVRKFATVESGRSNLVDLHLRIGRVNLADQLTGGLMDDKYNHTYPYITPHLCMCKYIYIYTYIYI